MELRTFSKEARRLCLQLCYQKRTAHLGSALSVIEVISHIFNLELEYDSNANTFRNDSHFILSKGHSALALYSVLYLKGIISSSDLESYATHGSIFEEHPTKGIPSVDFPTGSLGHGLPIACGVALGNKLQGNNGEVFVLMSDGECNEGSVWEAAQFAVSKNLNSLIVFVDHNKWQATGRTTESLGSVNLKKAFEGFNWHVSEIDGHNFQEIAEAIDLARKEYRPSIIVAHTIKGAGISFMEDDNNWHYRSPNEDELERALRELS
jgi:transketolase